MKIVKLFGHASNTGGIVNFQNGLQPFADLSQDKYYHFRTGSIQKSKFLSNKAVRLLDQILSYLYFPLYLLIIRPDVIEINSSLVPNAFKRDFIYAKIAKWFRPKANLVLFNHGWNYDFKQSMQKNNPNKLSAYFHQFDQIIVLANAFKNELKADFDISGNKVHIITTAIELSTYTEFISANPHRFDYQLLFLSRIEKTKGIVEILDAVDTILENYPKASLTIAGSGSYLAEIKKHPVAIKHAKQIKFPGYVRNNEKLKIFNQADILLFPSYGEGCPVTILEALAMGLPIIYTKVGAIPDILVNNENGIAVNMKESEPITHAISQLFEDETLRKKMIDNNKKLGKKFDIQTIQSNLEKIYALS